MATRKTSILTAGPNNHLTSSEEANYLATDFVTPGVLGSINNTNGVAPSTGAYAVNAQGTPNMTVAVTGGVIYVATTPSSQAAQILRTSQDVPENVTIAPNSSGTTKYDYIYVAHSAVLAAAPDLNGTTIATLVTSRSSNATTDDGGTAPSYGQLLAVVTVPNGATSITAGQIRDRRTQGSIGVNSLTISDWRSLSAYGLSYGSNIGAKEFTVNILGVDLTGVIPNGARFKVNRAVTPPTQSMAFSNASSQYATKAAPTGITLPGNTYTIEAMVYLNSYAGTDMAILSRYDGTNGFGLIINNQGLLKSFYIGAAAQSRITSFMTIPLKRWVHVAAVISSISGKLGAIYVNGQIVPNAFDLTGTTTLTQAGPLQVGAYNSSSFFDGYLSEVRLWSSAQTQAQINANMGINLVGNEANLLALFQGGGNFNDATANANNLTSTNGAIATQAANPFNPTEYFLVHKTAFTGGNTVATLFGGTDYILPNASLLNASYATVKQPFGFPSARGKWVIDALLKVLPTPATASTGVWYQPGSLQIAIPTGEWVLTSMANIQQNNTAAASTQLFGTLSTSPSSESEPRQTTYLETSGASGANSVSAVTNRVSDISLAAQTTYFYIVKAAAGGGTISLYVRGDVAMSVLRAESAYA